MSKPILSGFFKNKVEIWKGLICYLPIPVFYLTFSVLARVPSSVSLQDGRLHIFPLGILLIFPLSYLNVFPLGLLSYL